MGLSSANKYNLAISILCASQSRIAHDQSRLSAGVVIRDGFLALPTFKPLVTNTVVFRAPRRALAAPVKRVPYLPYLTPPSPPRHPSADPPSHIRYLARPSCLPPPLLRLSSKLFSSSYTHASANHQHPSVLPDSCAS